MIAAIPLTWLQLKREKTRLAMAVLGVGFAVVLVFMQLGFRDALFEGSVRYHNAFNYDLAMISPKTDFIVRPESFSRRRLYQALGVPGVEDVAALYLGLGLWKNPAAPGDTGAIFVVGFDPANPVFELSGIETHRELLKLPDVVLYDEASRPEFGPIPDLFRASDNGVETEVANRRVRVIGLFNLGTSFGIDASLVTSDLNFRRMFPRRQAGKIDLGLIRLSPGEDLEAAREQIRARIPEDVVLLTRESFVAREVAYWSSATPIGYIFSFGAIIGLTVGAIIVYQILFADVSEHLNEYATLRALGYPNRFISGIVIQQAVILGVLGYIPGVLAVSWLYEKAATATSLPLYVTTDRAVTVFVMTLTMCAISAVLALGKVRRLDPADVF